MKRNREIDELDSGTVSGTVSVSDSELFSYFDGLDDESLDLTVPPPPKK